jgi:hypothetical protein
MLKVREGMLAKSYYPGSTRLMAQSGGHQMRRFISVTMVGLLLAAIITGIAESHIHPGNSGSHTVLSILFITLTFIHIIINRKAFVRHFLGKTPKVRQIEQYGEKKIASVK